MRSFFFERPVNSMKREIRSARPLRARQHVCPMPAGVDIKDGLAQQLDGASTSETPRRLTVSDVVLQRSPGQEQRPIPLQRQVAGNSVRSCCRLPRTLAVLDQ